MIRFMTDARIAVRVHASARRDELVGIRDGVLIVRVTAPAIEGRANESLCRLIAKRVRVPRSSVAVIQGHRSRDKVVQINGANRQAVLDALDL
jgi:uncharacterized protein (TIGR00251 family)